MSINSNLISNFINQPSKKFFKSKINTISYNKNKKKIYKLTKKIFNKKSICKVYIEGMGIIKFPFFSFGNIKSYHLWDIEDLILFSFYKKRKNYYQRAIDLGANIGLHSILFAKLGYKKVISYEPDPKHFKQLKKNLKINECKFEKIYQKAIFNKKTFISFYRILDNTTSSHIANLKKNPYGKINSIKVETENFISLFNSKKKTLMKIDIEGAEADCILSTNSYNWKNTDAFVEISDNNSAKKIFFHCKKIKLKIFSHKKGWKKIRKLKDMPNSYREGVIFISKKNLI